MLHDEHGNVVEDWVAEGFERVAFGWAGGLYDPDTGLLRFGARDYDPEIGRWTAPDPIGFGGGDGNLYTYVGNDPVNVTDVSGLYDSQVHYLWTYIWARRVGFKAEEAWVMARANNDFDAGLTNPFFWPMGTYYHFDWSKEELDRRLDEAIRMNDLVAFGQGLHQLQDSYSHRGFHWFTLGHFFAGHEPDRYDPSSPRDIAMGIEVRRYMKQFLSANRPESFRRNPDFYRRRGFQVP
jgi:RHS repeat-associated protein